MPATNPASCLLAPKQIGTPLTPPKKNTKRNKFVRLQSYHKPTHKLLQRSTRLKIRVLQQPTPITSRSRSWFQNFHIHTPPQRIQSYKLHNPPLKTPPKQRGIARLVLLLCLPLQAMYEDCPNRNPRDDCTRYQTSDGLALLVG